jgi:hypothetical protein
MEYDLLNGVGYRPDADQRTYRPPEPPEPFAPPSVMASAVRPVGTVFEQVHETMVHAVSEWQRHIAKTDEAKQHYTPEGYQAQLAKFAATDAAKAVDTAEASATARVDQAAAQFAKIRKDLSPNGDTAAEIRADRYWNRTKPLLDSAKAGAVLKAQKLIASASREELGTLLQELPAYLEAGNHPTDWIDAAVGQAVPEYGRAAAQLKKAQQARTIAGFNAKKLRETFAHGHAGSFVTVTDGRKYDPDKSL